VNPDLHITAAAAADLLAELSAIASRAAAAIMRIDRGGVATVTKPDLTPVTVADLAAQSVILDGLARLLPGMPVISEEADDRDVPPLGRSFVLVDPLDGTREFIAGRDEFTVNIAIVTDGSPVAGVVAAPALGTLWLGAVGHGAERLYLEPGAAPPQATDRRAIHTRHRPAAGFTAAVSRSHLDARTEAFLARLPVAERIDCGSALKFCRLAEGVADIYPRLAPTCEWDIAAGQAVLVAAGGVVADQEGRSIRYGRYSDAFRVPQFIAWGDPAARDAQSPLL
jgi:3'(2'), 5'-bisphosphate nucleotidase